MKLKDILAKVAAMKELSEDEITFLAEYKEPEGIPKSRLDDVIAKRKTADKKAEELQEKIDELTEKIDDMQNKDLSESDKVKKDTEKQIKVLEKKVTDLTTERDTANSNLSEMKFNSSVTKLTAKHGFKDTEYLSYLVKQKGEDFDFKDEAGSTGFMENLKKESPKQFTVDTKSGAGSGEGDGKEVNDKFVEAKKDGDINAMLANAPEIE